MAKKAYEHKSHATPHISVSFGKGRTHTSYSQGYMHHLWIYIRFGGACQHSGDSYHQQQHIQNKPNQSLYTHIYRLYYYSVEIVFLPCQLSPTKISIEAETSKKTTRIKYTTRNHRIIVPTQHNLCNTFLRITLLLMRISSWTLIPCFRKLDKWMRWQFCPSYVLKVQM